MGHPEIDNTTPFAFELLPHSDEDGRTLVVALVKATYDVLPSGALELSEVQRAVNLAGEHWGDPETSAYKYEPEIAYCKPNTDVVLVGHAHAPRSSTTSMQLKFQVGPLHKALRVSGDRVWRQTSAGVLASPARTFEKIPISYDRAYGGWDRSHPDPAAHSCEPRNPSGVGYRGKGTRFIEGSPLPNLEDAAHALTTYAGSSVPAGFGFTSPHWHPRSTLCGTYDRSWAERRSPLLPKDFQRTYFNAASTGLIAKGYLKGDELVVAEGVSPVGALRTRLPALSAPRCVIRRRAAGDTLVQTQLDTIILDSDARQLILLWRKLLVVPEGLQGVASVHIACDNAPARKAKPSPPSNVFPITAAPKRTA